MNQTTGISPTGLVKSNLDFMTMNLMDRLGDNNKQIQTKSEQLCLQLVNHSIGGVPFMIGHIAKAQNEKKKTAISTKHQVGRL